MPKTLILCDCAKSQPLSEKVFSRVDGIRCSRVHTALCTAESGAASKLIAKGDAIVACLQERAVFEELADELGVEAPDFVDIRDRAGWSDELWFAMRCCRDLRARPSTSPPKACA